MSGIKIYVFWLLDQFVHLTNIFEHDFRYGRQQPLMSMVLGKIVIPKLNLLPILLARASHSWTGTLYTVPVQHPILRCYSLLPNSFQSLLTGFTAFIIEILYARKPGWYHESRCQILPLTFIIPSNGSHVYSWNTCPHPASLWVNTLWPPSRPLISPPSSFSLAHCAPSPPASCCFWNSRSIFLPQHFSLVVPSAWRVLLLDSSMVAYHLLQMLFRFRFECQLLREPFPD